MVRRYALELIIICFLTECEKQSGESVVLSKEHIAAAPPTTETSTAEHPPSSNEKPRAIPDDEITVDGYVMKPEVRGTSRDPRSLKEEQWLVKVQMVHDRAHLQRPDRANALRQTKGGRQLPSREIH